MESEPKKEQEKHKHSFSLVHQYLSDIYRITKMWFNCIGKNKIGKEVLMGSFQLIMSKILK